MFGCKACKVLQDENKHLRGLVDRLMAQIAPKDETVDPRLRPLEQEGADVKEQITYGVPD